METTFSSGQAVRFIGGKYNGFQGVIRWLGDSTASVVVVSETNKEYELIESTKFIQDLATWKQNKSATELELRSNQ